MKNYATFWLNIDNKNNPISEECIMNLRPGDVVFGSTKEEKYAIVRILGSGRFGVVYEIQDDTGRSFALKTIITASSDAVELQSFVNEANLAMEIKHDNVARYLFFNDGKQYAQFPPYILMEYADGGTLHDLMLEQKNRNELFGSNELRAMLMQLASGMKAINKKLVHRDIKPDNILIADDVLKISDFGLSKIVGAATRSRTLKGINHVRYCAPEAWRLEENAPEMDIYSMGIVFYEAVTLAYPYSVEHTGDIIDAYRNAHLFDSPTDPSDYNADLDLGLVQMILKMLSKRPNRRYSSWEPIIKRLQSSQISSTNTGGVDSLVEHALNKHKSAEKQRLLAQKETKRKREYEKSVAYCFRELFMSVKNIADEFNAASLFVKLSLHQSDSLSFSLYVEGQDSPIEVNLKVVYGKYDIKGQPIRAWGYVKAPSGRGFNLLLIGTSIDDLYGQWQALYVRNSALVRHPDPRPEPFPFEFNELPEEIGHLAVMHVYSTSVKPFEPEMLNSLIEEIL